MTRDPDHSAAPPADTTHAFPLDPAQHHVLAEARRAAGDELGAVAHLIAAHTLDAYASRSAEASVSNLCDVATGYFMKGDHDIAASWYELVLTLDPIVAIACQNLAAIHAGAGRTAQADAYRERAYRIQRVFVEQAPGQMRRVLVLCAARASGNVPFDALLPGAINCRMKYAIDYAADAEDAQLPPCSMQSANRMSRRRSLGGSPALCRTSPPATGARSSTRPPRSRGRRETESLNCSAICTTCKSRNAYVSTARLIRPQRLPAC
jgi:tetratricopeptide (TPR) repeat protein